MNIFNAVEPKLAYLKRFYFLEYFYILLKSISKYDNEKKVFEDFLKLKEKFLLGESKYKKLGTNNTEITNKQFGRFLYTFNEIAEESILYGLITIKNKSYQITEKGLELIEEYENKGASSYNLKLLELIEAKLSGFHYLINSCYRCNNPKGGLLIFPIYSPLKLEIAKQEIKTTSDLINYCQKLQYQLQFDIQNHLGRKENLEEANIKLINRLIEGGVIGKELTSGIDPDKYNSLIKKIRDYWLNFFIKEIYQINLSLSFFEILAYRGRQIGIVNMTEFYPNFNGKVVYPTSILITDGFKSADFKKIYTYPNQEKLLIHEPLWENFKDTFVNTLYSSYHDLKRSNRSYFINLMDLREIVCYKLKISYKLFVDFLQEAYILNLDNELSIKISLEADKLPDETKAIYLRREPIVIQDKLRNIIAIDIKNSGK